MGMNKVKTRPGVPVMSLRPEEEVIASERELKKAADVTSRPETDLLPEGIRKGDTGLGTPVQLPGHTSFLTEAEKESIRRREDEEMERLVDAIMTEKQSFKLPRFLFNSTSLLLVAAAASIAGLVVSNEVLTLLDKIASQPQWAQYLWYGALGIMSGAVALAGGRLAFLYARLARNPEVRFQILSELSKRGELRKVASRRLDKAKTELEKYLSEYPLKDKKGRVGLTALGFEANDLEFLAGQKEMLLNKDLAPAADEWIVRFRDGFQARLDRVASRVIRARALKVGLKTAATPSGLVDTLIVAYSSFQLIGDLCAVYNLRMGAAGTAAIMGRAFVYAYVASEIEEIFEQVSELIFQGADGLAGAAAIVAPKVAEGKANAFLVWRLGKATAALLRPVSPG